MFHFIYFTPVQLKTSFKMGGAGSVMSNFTHTKPPRPGLFVCEGIAGTKPLLPGGVPGAHPLEALVVTVGPHGCPVLSSSRDIHEENTLPPSTYVAIVLDPRSLTNEVRRREEKRG